MARRFVTYNTEDQKAGRVNVDHNGVMKPGGGTGLPSDVGAYKYMATDGEGNWVAEDRLAWKEGEKVEITWDGNTEGLTTVAVVDDTSALYKVSGVVLDDAEIKVGVVSLSNGERVNVSDTWELFVENGLVAEDIVLLGEYGIAFVRKNGATLMGITFPEPGVYFLLDHDDYTASFISDNQTTHPIPAEYLPEMPFCINITPAPPEYDYLQYVADKSYAEVKEAEAQKRPIVGTFTHTSGLVYTLIGCDGAAASCFFAAFDVRVVPKLFKLELNDHDKNRVNVYEFELNSTEVTE